MKFVVTLQKYVKMRVFTQTDDTFNMHGTTVAKLTKPA